MNTAVCPVYWAEGEHVTVLGWIADVTRRPLITFYNSPIGHLKGWRSPRGPNQYRKTSWGKKCHQTLEPKYPLLLLKGSFVCTAFLLHHDGISIKSISVRERHSESSAAAHRWHSVFTFMSSIRRSTWRGTYSGTHTAFPLLLTSSQLSAGRGLGGCSPQAGPFLLVFAHFIVIEPAAKYRGLKELAHTWSDTSYEICWKPFTQVPYGGRQKIISFCNNSSVYRRCCHRHQQNIKRV